MLFDLARDISFLRDGETTCELSNAHAPRQLKEGKGVAPRFRHDPIADPFIQSTWDDRLEQGACVPLVEPADQQLRETRQLVFGARLAHPEHERHRLGQKSSGNETQDLARSAIEPLRVIHQTHKRPFLGDFRHQAECGQGHEEPIRWIALCDAECDLQCLLLWFRERVELAEHRGTQLVQPREWQLHLSLNT
ncbi:MAG: hypothetical protein WB765_20235 [Acidimicrobiales bacterium]